MRTRARAESNFEIQALLKHALETVDNSCCLLKFSWLVLETHETLDALETLETTVTQTWLEINGIYQTLQPQIVPQIGSTLWHHV